MRTEFPFAGSFGMSCLVAWYPRELAELKDDRQVAGPLDQFRFQTQLVNAAAPLWKFCETRETT